ncbi:MAG: hypothetical protein ABEI13_01005, partial [Candidatus Paceibacteria bacterium]
MIGAVKSGRAIVLAALIALFLPAVSADWWNANYEQRAVVEVDERSGKTLQNYPVVIKNIDIGSSSSDSIRLVRPSDNTILPFAERVNGEEVNLAFKISVDASSNNKYEVYFDNPDAGDQSSGWNSVRYNFHDNFNDGQLDGWVTTKGDWYESGGKLQNKEDGNPDSGYFSNFRVENEPMHGFWKFRISHSGDNQYTAHFKTDDDYSPQYTIMGHKDKKFQIQTPDGTSSSGSTLNSGTFYTNVVRSWEVSNGVRYKMYMPYEASVVANDRDSADRFGITENDRNIKGKTKLDYL